MSNEKETSIPDEQKQDSQKSRPVSPELVSQLEAQSSPEGKIRCCIDFMRAALSGRAPRFKDYWDAKKICLPFFKEALAPHVRTVLWGEYVEISTEARHLKTLFDEQSAFAMEQIDLAIQGVEADLTNYDELLSQAPPIQAPDECQAVEAQKDEFLLMQRELNLLNALASRINSLRKEVTKTEMRIRFKNKFFDRLSQAGDRVFPKRKELIHRLSELFLSAVEAFTQNQFTDEALTKAPIVTLKEEIKDLQSWSKLLTLDTQTFGQARTKLSECWDKLKIYDQERKQEFAEKKETFKKNVETVMDKIKLLNQRCLAENFSIDDAMKQSRDILSFMKTIELGREEFRYLKEEISKARAPVEERLDQEHQAREKEMEEASRQRRDKIEEFKKKIQEAASGVSEKSVEELSEAKDELQKQLNLLQLTHAERELLEHSLKELRDQIIDKKEKAISALTLEEKNSLLHLQQALGEWKRQKNEIRDQLEIYRKALSGSGFDFEKAMRYRELMDAEKIRLDKVNAAIEEIESKIEELENT